MFNERSEFRGHYRGHVSALPTLLLLEHGWSQCLSQANTYKCEHYSDLPILLYTVDQIILLVLLRMRMENSFSLLFLINPGIYICFLQPRQSSAFFIPSLLREHLSKPILYFQFVRQFGLAVVECCCQVGREMLGRGDALERCQIVCENLRGLVILDGTGNLWDSNSVTGPWCGPEFNQIWASSEPGFGAGFLYWNHPFTLLCEICLFYQWSVGSLKMCMLFFCDYFCFYLDCVILGCMHLWRTLTVH